MILHKKLIRYAFDHGSILMHLQECLVILQVGATGLNILQSKTCALTRSIIAKKGSCITLFQPMHMSRKCVMGSLEGWMESSSNVVDDVIGYDKENLTMSVHLMTIPSC